MGTTSKQYSMWCLGEWVGICVFCNEEKYSMKYRGTFLTGGTAQINVVELMDQWSHTFIPINIF